MKTTRRFTSTLTLLIVALALGLVSAQGTNLPLTLVRNQIVGAQSGGAVDPVSGAYVEKSGYDANTTYSIFANRAAFEAGTPGTTLTLDGGPGFGTYDGLLNGKLYGRSTNGDVSTTETEVRRWNASTGATELILNSVPGMNGTNRVGSFNWGGYSGVNVLNDDGQLYILGVNSAGTAWELVKLNADLTIASTLAIAIPPTQGYAFIVKGQLFFGSSYDSKSITTRVNIATGAVSTVSHSFTGGSGSPYITNTFYDAAADCIYLYDNRDGKLYRADGAAALLDFFVEVTNTNDSGAGSLRSAINAANTAGDAVITFDSTVFDPATAPHVIDLFSALPKLSSNITIQGPGANVLTVERSFAGGTPDFSVFFIGNGTTSGPTVTISGMTIANGNDIGVISIFSTLHLDSCIITGNTSSVYGGGVFTGGSNGTGTLIVNNCTFSLNSATTLGGAIMINGVGAGSNATVTVTNSTFSQNSASQGGGIYNGGNSGSATLTVVNSTFSQNSAISGGGGILNDGSNGGSATLSITNSTFSQNSSANGFGGGIFNDGASSGSALFQIGNTILKRGATGENIFNYFAAVTSLGYNLSSDVGVTNSTGGTGALNATGDQVNTDPLLDPAGLQDNGGPTKTIALKSGSPAIDKGKDMDKSSNLTGQDQRGSTRPIVNSGITPASGGDHSDIGAFELASTYRSEKQAALALVQSLIPSGNSTTDKLLLAAANQIASSLAPALWVDDFHLGPKSESVFKFEKTAAQNLLKVVATGGAIAVQAQNAINELVAVDKEIAQLAIDEATSGGGDPKTIAQANAQMTAAQQALTAGRPDTAIDKYKKAWQSAIKSRK